MYGEWHSTVCQTAFQVCMRGRALSFLLWKLKLAVCICSCVGRTQPQNIEMYEASGTLCISEALQDSEYGYFKSNILSAWAGPQHWKVKADVKGTYL